ncbi:hypothetical protein DY000_02012988, partial [Brassica cretica]
MSEHEGKDVKKVSEGQWTTGLYDCFSEDIPTCQGLAGLMVVAMSHIGCGWYYASTYRAKLRRQYSLPEEPCSDGAIHFFCCSCALSQEHRELKYRGLDPSLGNQSLFSPLFSNDAILKFKGTSQGLAGLMVLAMSHIGCGWYYASTYRAKLRRQYSLPEEPCSDGAIHFFCCSCALSQEHRELKYRGLDPSL